MDYVNLGATGMRVSRVCLGMMSYGKHESRPWTLDEEAAEPIVRRAVDGGIEEEREMIPQCIDQRVAVIPWSPLARGLLAGNRTREGEKLTTRARTDAFGDSLYDPEVDFEVIDRADEVDSARGVPTGQMALAWLLQRPGVTAPIIGATRLTHLEDALAAEQLSLRPEEVQRLEEAYVPHAIAGHS